MVEENELQLPEDSFGTNFTVFTLQVTPENTFDPDMPLCTTQELFYVDDIESAHKDKTDQTLGSVADFLLVNDSQVQKITDSQIWKSIIKTKNGFIVHCETESVQEIEEVLPTLAEMITTWLRLTRFSLWIQVANLDSEQELSMLPLCTALDDAENIRWIDVNVVKVHPLQPDLHIKNFSLAKLIPRLERFSLGNCSINAIEFLSGAGALQLQHLKLDCESVTFEISDFCRQLSQENNVFTKTVTFLALKYTDLRIIPLVAEHFKQLRSLKLFRSNAFDRRFDQNLATPLGELAYLTELTLIDFDLLTPSQIKVSLPNITKLTLTSSDNLFQSRMIKNEMYRKRMLRHSPEEMEVNVGPFIDALFAQFPDIEQLTLVGFVQNAEEVHQQLNDLLGERLDQLVLFLKNSD